MATSSAFASDLNRTGISRYFQLATLFRARIESGQWPLGQQIPTVNDLADDCGVSRATIRQALDLLEKEKLIERFRAKGTFVRKRPRENLWFDVSTDWTGLLRSVEASRIELVAEKRNARLPETAEIIGEPAGAYRFLRKRHNRKGLDYLIGNSWLDEAIAGPIAHKDLATKSAFKLISEVPGLKIGRCEQLLTIGAADMDVSQALAIPMNSPVATLQRQVVDHRGRLILYVEGVYRGDVVRLGIKLR
jgi:GntR family transcriptional regulator